MSLPLRVLIVEDNDDDRLLLLRTLRQGGYEPLHRCVQTVAALSAALAKEPWDLVLSDYRLPQFNGAEALRLVQESGLDMPFIIVSGVIGEEQAVAIMKAGAHDYVLKDKLIRLVPAITRELRDAEVRRRRRQAEEQLRASEAQFRLLFEANPNPMWVFDEETLRFLAVNGTALRHYGYTRDEFLALSVADIRPPDDRAMVHALIASQTGSTENRIGEFRHQKKDGTLIDVEIAVSSIPFNGRPGRLVLANDISQRRETELTLRRAKAEAERASQAKSSFLASVSHELRTPLNAVMGFSQVLENEYFGPLTGKQKEYVTNIYESGKHLLNIINDILDLSKIEAGKMDPCWAHFEIGTLLANSFVLIRDKCAKHGIQLTLDMAEPVRGLKVTADERLLKQILYNLLSNAAKFTPDGGAISLQARVLEEAEPTLEVSVTDTGIGIAPEHHEKVFEAFYQVRYGTADKTPGTGLGLSLVKQLLELHNGRIWVTSEGEGRGSRFTFVIPVNARTNDGVTFVNTD